MEIRSLKLKDNKYGNRWKEEIVDRWDYDDCKADKEFAEGWISMDCCLYDKADELIYLGITSFVSDIFKAYDRKADKFIDLGYDRVVDKFDAKFHRSLVFGKDNNIYAAIALLHDVDKYYDAPGSAIVRYNKETKEIAKVGIPIPHTYIQSIVIDEKKENIYCQCFAPEYLAVYNIESGETRNLGLIGTAYGGMVQGENLIMDNDGCVWINWSLTRAWQDNPGADGVRLAKYDPKADKMHFFKKGLPKSDGSYGTIKSESLINFGDGYLYAGADNGSFYRINTETADAEYLFTPTPDRRSRLSSAVKAEDGVAYAVTGRDGECELLRILYKEGKFEKLGAIADKDGTKLWQCHDMTIAEDGTLYICENDSPHRSSYLWEIKEY
ncbi:MAG: NHL repeat-containing protein [Planctomycetota bacterium]|jgi:hypothetical protein